MKRTNETGRSMVEMLGVLAIIGVLSIGGIAGYTTAMNRYRANEALDLANKYATVVYTACETYKAMNPGTTECNDPADFDKTGLGTLPSGVSVSTSKAQVTSSGVEVVVGFDEHNICKAAASATGSECKTDGTTPAKKYYIKYTIAQS